MKKSFITLILFILLLTPVSQVSAQTTDRDALMAQLQSLLLQLASLQAKLSSLQEERTREEILPEKRVLGVSARNLEPSKYYRGTYEATYIIKGILPVPYSDTKVTQNDRDLWNLWKKVLGNQVVSTYITEFRIYNDSDSEFDAFVEQMGTSDDWIVGVNLAGVSLKNESEKKAAIELFTHEFAHILFHYNFKVAGVFEDEFWKYSSNRPKDFVSDYAMISAEEDFAESFMYFVLNPRLSGNSKTDEKVLFFYDYDSFIDIREDIRDRLFD